MEWWQVQELLITGAVIVGVLVPVFALTYRFLSKTSPWRRGRVDSAAEASAAALQEARLDGMERQLEEIEASVRRLAEASEFDRQLNSGPKPGAGS